MEELADTCQVHAQGMSERICVMNSWPSKKCPCFLGRLCSISLLSFADIYISSIFKRSAQMGELLRQQLVRIQQQFPNFIKEVRGKGLFNAVELDSKALSPITAYDICLKLKERGILAKPTHDSIIRLTPPLCMSLEELQEGSKTLPDVLEFDIPKMLKEKPKTVSPKTSSTCDRCGRDLYGSS